MRKMSDYSNVREPPPPRVIPQYNGYQLIGDNQFLHFSERLLNLKCIQLDGLNYLGLCVRGQKIIDLLRRIHNGFADVSEKVVLMIGTNDLLHGTSFEAMCEDFKELIKQLLSKNAKQIILLTVPPVLKLENNEDHWKRLKKFNEFIRQCRDDETIFVGDAYEQFIVSKEPLQRKSSPSNSIFTHCCSPKSTATPIQYSKWIGCREPSLSPGNVDELSFPRGSWHPSHNSGVTTAQKASRRQFFEPKSHHEDCQSSAAKRRCSLSASRRISSWMPNSLFAMRSFRGFIRFPATHSGGDSFKSSSGRGITPKGTCTSYFFSPKSSGYDNSFLTPARRAIMPERNFSSNGRYAHNSYSSQRLFSHRGDSSTTPSRSLTHERNYNSSYVPTTLSSGDDSHTTSSRKVLTPKKKRDWYTRPESYHNKRTEDEANIDDADKIRDECFEQYFSSDCKRHLVHLNLRGLCALRGIMQGIIEIIDEKTY